MHRTGATTLVPRSIRQVQLTPCLAPSRHPATSRARLSVQNCTGVLTAQQVSRSTAHQDLLEKLNELLAGVKVKTRKATAKAVKVVHVSKARLNHRKFDHRPRCTGLDLDIAWEAIPHPHDTTETPTEPLQGLARVKLTTSGCDKVSVTDIQMMEQKEDAGVPCMPSAEPAPPEVIFAVESMDSAIMEHLNDFMWEMEQSKDFPLASFETDEEESDAESAAASMSMEPEEITARLLGLMLPDAEPQLPVPVPSMASTPTPITPEQRADTVNSEQQQEEPQPLLPGLPRLLQPPGPEPFLA